MKIKMKHTVDNLLKVASFNRENVAFEIKDYKTDLKEHISKICTNNGLVAEIDVLLSAIKINTDQFKAVFRYGENLNEDSELFEKFEVEYPFEKRRGKEAFYTLLRRLVIASVEQNKYSNAIESIVSRLKESRGQQIIFASLQKRTLDVICNSRTHYKVTDFPKDVPIEEAYKIVTFFQLLDFSFDAKHIEVDNGFCVLNESIDCHSLRVFFVNISQKIWKTNKLLYLCNALQQSRATKFIKDENTFGKTNRKIAGYSNFDQRNYNR